MFSSSISVYVVTELNMKEEEECVSSSSSRLGAAYVVYGNSSQSHMG